MSDYICFEIQAEIMKRLPVKSLIRFRLVSKPWKALIESSEFITEYYLHNIHQQQRKHLLIRYLNPQDSEYKYVSVVDNDTFPLQKLSVTVPVSLKLLYKPEIVSSQGLFCLYDYRKPSNRPKHTRAVIWNPLITKTVYIEVPNVLDSPYATVVGFCVCPKTTDIKLVKIAYCRCVNGYEDDSDDLFDDLPSFPWQVEVYSLSSKVWRSPLCSKLPRNSIELTPNQVDLDGVVYWRAYETVMVNDELKRFNLIMSFDMTSEEFAEVCLPDSLAPYDNHLDISKLRESLVVFEYKIEVDKRVCNVWMMEHGDQKSFTMLFAINMTDTSIPDILGFRVSGELVTIMRENDFNDHRGPLFIYEPYSKNISYATSYPETLLLLDR